MQALDAEWPQEISKPTFAWERDGAFMGRGAGGRRAPTYEEFEFNRSLYADDAALIFATKQEMQLGVEYVFKKLKSFGLEMHVGRGGARAKTEAMCVPASGKEASYAAADLSDLTVD
ncbi:hypothetical protein T484DRAFT_1660720, partial [Baffinella frigidus]